MAGDEELYKDTRTVVCLRVLLVLVLAVAATVVGVFTYTYVSNVQKHNFKVQYEDSVQRVAQGSQHGINTKVWAANTFSAMYTSRYGQRRTWPNATLPDFQEQAYGLLQLSAGRAISFNPIISNATRAEWEAHATENAEILGAPSLLYRVDANSRIISDGIYQKKDGVAIDDPGYAPGSRYPFTMVPVWQIAPIVTNEKAVMFNLHAETNRQRALDDMLSYKVPALTAILQLVQDSELRPSSILFFPVFDNFVGTQSQDVEGSVSVVFSWDIILRNLLPNYINGIICVLGTNIGQRYSYRVNGENVVVIGEGDLHETKFDSMRTTVNVSLEGTNAYLGAVDNLITYFVDIYPSSELQSVYITNSPIIYTTIVVMIFFVTSAIFLLYVAAVRHKQNVIVRAAVRSSQIVDSFFPSTFRDRMFGHHDMAMSSATNSRSRTVEGKNRSIIGHLQFIVPDPVSKVVQKQTNIMMRFLMPPDDKSGLTMTLGSEPIADLFPCATVMFADIAGFTSWSSERDPADVFRLLEALFKQFDDVANKLGVFKISTIGDCYLAVVGLPDPRVDHAEVLSMFAIECQTQFRIVVRDLIYTLGPDTSKLEIRTGLHSGPVTAGVLRGLKSRFEIFGDTVNTAARMESNGMPSRVQISQQTADLLAAGQKHNWFFPREEKISAKGKGQLQTFWLSDDVIQDELRLLPSMSNSHSGPNNSKSTSPLTASNSNSNRTLKTSNPSPVIDDSNSTH